MKILYHLWFSSYVSQDRKLFVTPRKDAACVVMHCHMCAKLQCTFQISYLLNISSGLKADYIICLLPIMHYISSDDIILLISCSDEMECHML